jgi:hypothetical protein
VELTPDLDYPIIDVLDRAEVDFIVAYAQQATHPLIQIQWFLSRGRQWPPTPAPFAIALLDAGGKQEEIA